MKKQLLLTLMVSLLAVSAWGTDWSWIEDYHGVDLNADRKTTRTAFSGNYANWHYYFARSKYKQDDKDVISGTTRGFWITNSGTDKEGYLECDLAEGGIKSISFDWKQETILDELDAMYLSIQADDTEVAQIQTTAAGGVIPVNSFSSNLNIKTNVKLTLKNLSTSTQDLSSHPNRGRFIVGPITITPYLRYMQKEVIIGLPNKGYINRNLLDQIEGGHTITYSIHDKDAETQDVATINPTTGAITPKAAGTAVVTATWTGEGAYTTYELTVSANTYLEAFSKSSVNSALDKTGEQSWDNCGDVIPSWKAWEARRKVDIDTILGTYVQGTQIRALADDNCANGYIKTAAPVEGGIKAATMKWKQYGQAANTSLQLQAYFDGEEAGSASVSHGGNNTNPRTNIWTYNPNFSDITTPTNPVFEIRNISTRTGDKPANVVIGSITITPWLLYSTKSLTWDRSVDLGATFTNTNLIDNTGGEGTIEYSISENTIGAAVDGDGVVTATGGGTVTVTASWEQVSTSYNLHIKANTTASFTNPVVNKNITEIAFTIAVNKTPNMAVANYTSSNENVAIVDENGTVTVRGVGQTTITATIAEDENYGGSSASYILRVTDNSTTNAVVEAFSAVPNGNAAAHAGQPWNGDVYGWRVSSCGGVRKNGDKFASDQEREGIWMGTPDPNTNYSSLTVENGVEGGIKHIWFYCEQPSGTGETHYTLKPVVYLDEAIEANKVGDVQIVGTSGDESIAANRTLFGASNVTKANSVLIIRNESYRTSTGLRPAADADRGRFLLDEIHITPWLLYTTKNVEWDRTTDDNASITNNALINNKTGEDPVTYSISENEIEAEVDGTGVVTATGGGTVTVTASWEQVSTSYDLHIIANTTASYEHDAIQIAYGAAVSNSLTRTLGYDGTIAYESSDPSVAEVDEEGNVTVRYIGETTITATLPETENYSAAQASYTLRVLPNDRHLETFNSIQTTANYTTLTGDDSKQGDECKWSVELGGFNSDAGAAGRTVDDNCARFKEAYDGSATIPYIESSTISGGISKLSFKCKAGGSESSTSWDIRVLVNGTLVETLTDCPTSDTQGWKPYTIENINVAGNFVLRFENRSTQTGAYTSGNRGRLLIDDIEWVGLTALADEGTTNTTIIEDIDEEVHSVQLADRTIRTGGYNTLCLPFDVSEETLQATLPGAKAYEFTNAYLSGTNLDIRFNKVAALEAGKPYLVTVPADVANPVFESVTIDESTTNNIIEGENMRFIGSFNKETMNETGLYVVADNLYRVSNITSEDKTIGACRAYFDVLQGAAAVPKNIRMRIVAGTNTATGIDEVNSEELRVKKMLINGQIFIIREGKMYNAQGQAVK